MEQQQQPQIDSEEVKTDEVEESTRLPGIYAEAVMQPSVPPIRYRILSEPDLTRILEEMANAISNSPGTLQCVSLQPCQDKPAANQDRITMAEWQIEGRGIWTFAAVFDGHGGHEDSEFAVKVLPQMILDSLHSLIKSHPIPEGTDAGEELDASPLAEQIITMLQDNITALDNQIRDEFLALFPDCDTGGVERLKELAESMSEDDIKKIINDEEKYNTVVRKVMCGSTVLIALVDPRKENLWIANLGDCQAFVVKNAEGRESFTGELVTQNHNMDNPREAERVVGEHPGEENVVTLNAQTGGRVLGAIMVGRAIGDFIFKLPSIVTRNVLMKAEPGFKVSVPIDTYLDRILTPPYVSNIPEIHHISLDESARYVVLASDGLSDLYRGKKSLEKDVADVLTRAEKETEKKNGAVEILRSALGGEDGEKVSMYLTLEKEGRWMDDTTVAVLKLRE